MGPSNALLSRLKDRGWFQVNFYRVHVLYFIFTILLTSVILWGSGANGNSDNEDARFPLSYIDALFLCTSAMTNTGLNTVNLSSITAFQQSILFVLMLMGNVTIVSIGTVMVRRHFIRKYMQEYLDRCDRARNVIDDIDKDEIGRPKSRSNGTHQPNSVMRRRDVQENPEQLQIPRRPQTTYRARHHEKGHGGLPYPWEWSITRNFGSKFGSVGQPIEDRSHRYLSFTPSLDERVSLPASCGKPESDQR